jgi:multicomponent Na+:H+ antiporter subunit A
MIAGAIDHATGEKDLAKLGGLRSSMPILFGATLLAALSMAGIPPFLGFIAKELLLDSVFAATESGRFGPLPIAAAILAASLMVAVIARFVVRAFFGPRQPTPHEPHEPPTGQLLGPVLLATLGLLAALLPALFALPILQPASAAILQATTAPDLGLWHGIKPALIASIAALAIGTGLFLGERVVLLAAQPFARLDAIGPANAYQGILAGVLGFASLQTRLLQSGYLRRYLFWTSIVTVVAVAGTFAARAKLADLLPGGRTPFEILAEARFYEVGLVVLIIVGALFTAAARTRLAAIGGLGLVGYGVALVFVLFGAPDLAITQLSVETLTVVLLVLVFRFLPDLRTISDSRRRVRDLAIAATGGAMMAGLVLLATTTSLDRHVSRFFAEASLPQAYGRNVVNVILVDFRGTDTLGEITVLAVAAVGVYTLLKMSPWSRPRRREAKADAGVEREETP